MMSINVAWRWLFDKMTDLIVSLWNWKIKVWFRMGWSRPLNVKGKKK
jgi:hypothetical protein